MLGKGCRVGSEEEGRQGPALPETRTCYFSLSLCPTEKNSSLSLSTLGSGYGAVTAGRNNDR